jgi:peptidyl-prolyl cis-trans isomerase C
MRLFKTGIFLAIAISLLGIGGCSEDKSSKSATPATKEPAAATVNGMPISQRAVDIMARQAGNAGTPDTPEARKGIIDQLALQMLAADEAIKKGLDKSPEVAEQMNVVRQSVLANAYVQDYIKNNPITDEMLKAEYDRAKAAISGSEYKARHILVASEAEARDIIARLKKNPGTFEKLASERSRDQGSKAQGGDLGWFDPRRMVPEFGTAVGKLEKGKFTEAPVQTQFGYHVILLEDTRPVEPPPLEQVKPMLSRQLQQQNLMKQLDSLRANAKIEIAAAPAAEPPTPAPAPAK